MVGEVTLQLLAPYSPEWKDTTSDANEVHGLFCLSNCLIKREAKSVDKSVVRGPPIGKGLSRKRRKMHQSGAQELHLTI
ncbi:hypothetical protein AMTR_s00070p00191820 [Amborella trichopoda]|uniref:Uncharacterized protein n=1 Tax=Amborella trichopoda TaxID=13333 RepID=U5D4Z7_AMBTC|nr:hypothetical protein AMTR_s00070p00191820 [Amborella trichopoda]